MTFATLLAAVALAGCAAGLAYREGNSLLAEGKTPEGLAKLDEASALEPGNAEYRIAALGRRAAVAGRQMVAGDAARRAGRLDDADKAYQEVLRYQPSLQTAKQGLEAVAAERRHRQALTQAEELFKQGGTSAQAEALEKLRPVLAEDPGQKEALALKAHIEEVSARESRPEVKMAAIYKKPITLEFRDAPLRSVFDAIARVSGLNFFFDKDVRPDARASVLAKNTTIQDAVRLLLITNQLEQQVLSENAILIYPSTPQKLREYQTLLLRIFNVSNADVKAVANTIRTMVKTKDLVVDERLGLIIMRDSPEAIRLAEKIVAIQDLSDPEVMLEVEVMEVQRDRLLELGVKWPSSVNLSLLPLPGNAPLTLSSLHDQLRSRNIQAVVGGATVTAHKDDDDVNMLANPRIRVRNREKAKIVIGDKVPIITTTSTASGFVSESVNYVDVGLKLEVEPNIYLDEEVGIKINLEVSSLGAEVVSAGGSTSYKIGTRNATTVLRLKDGETQILAGLISDEDRASAVKVPLLGELPVVGRLFGSHTDGTKRTEILLSITPRVLRSIRRLDLRSAEFEAGTEASIGGGSLRLNAVDAVQGATPAPGAVGQPVGPSAIQQSNMPPLGLPGVPSPGSPATVPPAGGIGPSFVPVPAPGVPPAPVPPRPAS